MKVSVIVPFAANLKNLEQVLAAVSLSASVDEILIAADGAREDCREIAARVGATTLEIDGPSGPARARNIAAQAARGDVLIFIDADVVVEAGALDRMVALLAERPDVDAVFGAYDDAPAAPSFASQYKNLLHAFVHSTSAGPAHTFWAGFGAVRRRAFFYVGGFDERFARPSVEDIDLGYRLTVAGFNLELVPSLRGKHLKVWTLGSMLHSDVIDRGVPWTQLLLRYGRFEGHLNVGHSQMACVALAYLLVALGALGDTNAATLAAATPLSATLVALGWPVYRHFLRIRGLAFALKVVPVHLVGHLLNGIAFSLGVLCYVGGQLGVGSRAHVLPADAWHPRAPVPTRASRLEPNPGTTLDLS